MSVPLAVGLAIGFVTGLIVGATLTVVAMAAIGVGRRPPDEP